VLVGGIAKETGSVLLAKKLPKFSFTLSRIRGHWGGRGVLLSACLSKDSNNSVKESAVQPFQVLIMKI
jgi:hypothetical protein